MGGWIAIEVTRPSKEGPMTRLGLPILLRHLCICNSGTRHATRGILWLPLDGTQDRLREALQSDSQLRHAKMRRQRLEDCTIIP